MDSDQPVKPLFNRSQPGSSHVSLLDARPAGTAPHVVSRGESEAVFGGPGILAVKGLQKSYRGRTVVQDAGLNVRAGEAVGLLGPNGAGKTTIFYMITGLVGADRGIISLDGHDVTGLPMYRRARLGIGYLPQEASIFRGLNVEDNIRAVLEIVEPSRKERERKLDALLDEFNITRLRKAPSIALSGGERRRCEIARALAGEPTFMLLDEPFAGIDPDRGRRHPEPRPSPDPPRHRRAHHGSQCPRDAGPHRPRLHHPFRPRAHRRRAGGHRVERGGAPPLSRRGLPALAHRGPRDRLGLLPF